MQLSDQPDIRQMRPDIWPDSGYIKKSGYPVQPYYKVMFPNFWHPNFVIYKIYIFASEIQFCNICERTVSFEIVLAFEHWFIIFVAYLQQVYKVHKSRMMKLGQGVEVRAHYPTEYCLDCSARSLVSGGWRWTSSSAG